MPFNRQQIAVVDFENFVGQIPQYPPLSVIEVCAILIERIGAGQYPELEMTWRIAAFSSDETVRDEEARYVTQASRLLDRMGYSVLSVYRRKDAADEKITQHAIGLLHDRRIKLCILGTQDSGLPFVEFLRKVRVRTRIHLIGYDYIPDSFEPAGIPFTLIKEDALRLLRAGHSAPQKRDAPVFVPRTLPHRSETIPATLAAIQTAPVHAASLPATSPAAPTARESAIAFLNGRPIADPRHLRWAEQVFRIIQTAVAEGWQIGFFSLYQKARWNMSRPFPPDNALRDIVEVMTDRFFERRSILVPKKDALQSFLGKLG